MSPKKRVAEDSAEDSDDASLRKNAKVEASDFRSKLKGPDPIAAVKEMLSQNKEDRMEEFVRQGGSLGELLTPLSDMDLRNSLPLAAPVFDAAAIYIIKCMSCFPERRSDLVKECRQLVNLHLTTLRWLISPSQPHKLIRIALKLLAGIVSCDESLCRSVMLVLRFSEEDVAFLSDPTSSSSLRSHFIRFLVAFLVDQPIALLRKFLNYKGVLTSVFAGLKTDKFNDIILLVSALKIWVVDNKDLALSTKILIFNSANFYHFIDLYSWQPPSNSNVDSAFAQDEVRRCVNELLLSIADCTRGCDPPHPLLRDSKFGGAATDRQFNQLIYSIIQGCGKSDGDRLKEELVVKVSSLTQSVVKAAYKQADKYITQHTGTSTTRRYVQAMLFYSKMVEGIDLDTLENKEKGKLEAIKTNLMPSSLLSRLSEGLRSEMPESHDAAVLCLSTCLARLQQYIPQLTSHRQALDNYLLTNCCDFGKELMSSVVTLCQRGDDEAGAGEGLVRVLQCLLTLHSINPLLVQCKSKDKLVCCLESIGQRLKNNGSEGEKERVWRLALLRTMQVHLALYPLDSTQAVWLEQLGEVVGGSLEPCDRDAVLSIVRQLLLSTGYFDVALKQELEIWMHCLSDHLVPDSVALVVRSTISCREGCTERTRSLYRDLVRAESEADNLAKTACTVLASSLPSLNLNDYITALEDCSKSNVEDDEVGASASAAVNCSNMSVSLALVSLLKNLRTGSGDDSSPFLVSLLTHLLHLHFDNCIVAGLLRLIARRSDGEPGTAVHSVLDYALRSINSRAQPLLIPPAFDSQSVYHAVSSYLFKPTSKFPDLSELSEFEGLLVCRLALFNWSLGGAKTDGVVKTLSAVLGRYPRVSDTLLTRQGVLMHCFQPTHPLDDASNSTSIVLTLVDHLSPGVDTTFLLPYKTRLSMELNGALRSREGSLHHCAPSLCTVLDKVGLPPSKVSSLLRACCPLPPQLKNARSEWRRVEERLLRMKGVEGEKLSTGSMLKHLEDVSGFLHLMDSEEDVTYLDTLGSYLQSNYTADDWDQDALRTLTRLAKKVLKGGVWSEILGRLLYGWTRCKLGDIALSRLATLMDLVCEKLSPAAISELLVTRSDNIVSELTCTDRHPSTWVKHFSQVLANYDTMDIGLDVEPVCQSLEERKEDLVAEGGNLELISALFRQVMQPPGSTHKTERLFNLLHHLLLSPVSRNSQQYPRLHEEIATKMEESMRSKGCKTVRVSSDACKALLATGLTNSVCASLRLLSTAVNLDQCEQSCTDLFALLNSHSNFLTVLLEGSSENNDIKCETVKLVWRLVVKEPALMKASHLPFYFSAYNATLSNTDQLILKLLQKYEESGVEVGKLRPYVWGEAARDKYLSEGAGAGAGRQRAGGATLAGDEEEGTSPTLSLLDQDVVLNTIKHFPSHRLTGNWSSEVEVVPQGGEMYDLEFMLGAVRQCVGPDSAVYPSEVPCVGVTSLALLALGSDCPKLRAQAYQILHSHYTSLSLRKDNQVWCHLLEKVQTSVCGLGENARLSGHLSVWLARAALVMADPKHHLYRHLHSFVLVKPNFELTSVPAFLEFFHSSDTQASRGLRVWILEVVRDGLRTTQDLQLLLSSFTFKLLLDFYSSSLASNHTKRLIDWIVERCVECDVRRGLLPQEYSLVPWLMFHGSFGLSQRALPTSHSYAPLNRLIQHRLTQSAH